MIWVYSWLQYGGISGITLDRLEELSFEEIEEMMDFVREAKEFEKRYVESGGKNAT